MTSKIRLASLAALAGLVGFTVFTAAERAAAQAVDLEALGINADFEDPELAHVNTTEAFSTNNIGPGWTREILAGNVSNYGVQDPVGEGANPFYCCFSGPAPDGVLPAPFQGRQIGFINLNDTDSMGQIVSIPVGSLLAGQTYSMTLAVGARSNTTATALQAKILYAIGMRTAGGVELGTPATITMIPGSNPLTANIQEITYNLNVNTQAAAFVGQDVSLFIRGANGSGGPSPPDLAQANFDNLRLNGTFGLAANNAPALTIDRATGAVTLSKTGLTNYAIAGYQLTSDTFGSFNQANWTKISVAYDQSGNDTVDPDDDWTVLSAANDSTDLSESEMSTGGNGGTLSTASPILLGTPWRKTPYQDVTARLLLTSGQELTVPVTYAGDAIAAGDLNGDGAINVTDWTTFKSNYSTSLTGMSIAQAYAFGDMDQNRLHTLADFAAFRAAYLTANPGATLNLFGVPEPGTAALLIAGLGLVLARRSRRLGRAMAAGAAALALGAGANPAQAVLVAGYNFEGNAEDVSGNNLHGTLNGAAALVTDPIRSGMVLQLADADMDLNSAFVDIADPTGLLNFSATGPHQGSSTVMAWIFSPDFTNHDSIFSQGEWNDGVSLTVKGDTTPPDQLWVGSIGANPAHRSDIGVPVNTWHHVAVVRNYDGVNTAVTFYIDGVATGYTEGGTFPGRVNAPVDNDGNGVGNSRLGLEWRDAGATNPRWPFNGRLDEVGVFDTALTQPEIANFMNNFPGAVKLELRVDATTGQMAIFNDNAEPLTISGYEISSTSGGLDRNGWQGIHGQSANGFPGGDNSGNGWELDYTSTNNRLTEFYLQGSSTVAPGKSINLGAAYNEAMDATDLVFQYSSGAGGVVNGLVELSTLPIPADFEPDGDVDTIDYNTFKANFGSQTATSTTGDANGDGVSNGGDFLVWQRNRTNTGSAAPVPEPAGIALALGACVALVALGRGRPRLALAFGSIHRGLPAFVMAACVGLAASAHAAVHNDREYRMGDDLAEGAVALNAVGSGNAFQTTFDSAGPGFVDLSPTNGPVYADVGPTGLNRPGAAANSLGITFDGADDYLFGRRFGNPATSRSSTLNFPVVNNEGPGANDYAGLSNRGFQLWVRPTSTGLAQNVVLDTNQHGLRINTANQWVMRYNNVDVASTEAVAFDAWTHAMVVRPNGSTAPSGGSILYINGEAVAAAAGNYNVNQNFWLVVGSDTGDGPEDDTPTDLIGTTEFFKGTLDQLTMFTMGVTVNGLDRGTWNFRTDNLYARPAAEGGFGGLTAHIADVNQNGTFEQADINDLITNWGFENLVNGVRAGDVNTIKKGDLNFDGITDLKDVNIIRDVVSASGAALDLSGLPIPEPSALVLAAAAGLAAIGLNRRRGQC